MDMVFVPYCNKNMFLHNCKKKNTNISTENKNQSDRESNSFDVSSIVHRSNNYHLTCSYYF